MCAFTPLRPRNVHVVGNDVTVNRPKVAAYRAPGAPIAVFGVESVIDEMAKKTRHGPDRIPAEECREGGHTDLLRASSARSAISRRWKRRGRIRTTARRWDRTRAAASPPASGSISATKPPARSICRRMDADADARNRRRRGGSRASMAMMVAEELGIEFERVRPVVGDTASFGFNFLTAGSRSTFASGMASVIAARQVIEKLRQRAAKIATSRWRRWLGKTAAREPAGANVGAIRADVAGRDRAWPADRWRRSPAIAEINARAPGPASARISSMSRWTSETGSVRILRYTVVQDVARRSIRPTSKASFRAAPSRASAGR